MPFKPNEDLLFPNGVYRPAPDLESGTNNDSFIPDTDPRPLMSVTISAPNLRPRHVPDFMNTFTNRVISGHQNNNPRFLPPIQMPGLNQKTDNNLFVIHPPPLAPPLHLLPAPTPLAITNTTAPDVTSNPKAIRLTWNRLTYKIDKTRWSFEGPRPVRRHVRKTILQPQWGEIVGGTITALMGPSGAGKSTLLSCITGRYTIGVGGDVLIRYPNEKRKRVTIAFVPQKDFLFPQFTVRETLVFASKLKNVGVNHIEEASKVMQSLNLESCADVKLSGCSGGEIKRVSIGVELISGPNIIVLDEPTSGLDSTNAIKCIRLLRDLALKRDGPAIVCTIHQPNHRIFADFTKVYLLAKNGLNIFFGPPHGLTEYFARHSLVQPEFSSPADYAIEVASGTQGSPELLTLMSKEQGMKADRSLVPSVGDECTTVPLQKVINKMRRTRSNHPVKQTCLLMGRSIEASCFKSSQLLFKVCVNILIAILISLLWADPTGTEDGCWQTGDVKGTNGQMTARDAYLDKISKITANCNLLFSTCVYLILVYSIGTVLVIPLEIKTVTKEIGNNWYSVTSYFISKSISDLPAVALSIFSLEYVCWIATKQITTGWRFMSTFGLSCLMGIICESVGVFLGIILSHDLVSATLVTMASSFPVLMFGGFLIKIADIPWYFQPMTYVSYTRYTFEGILASVYGFGRCKEGGIDTVDFMKELSSAQNPIDILTTVWQTFNVTPADAQIYAPMIGVPQDHLESVLNGTMDYFGLGQDHGQSNGTETLNGPAPQPSYVMSYFKLDDDVLRTSFVSLILIVLFIKVAIYYLLSYKTKRNR